MLPMIFSWNFEIVITSRMTSSAVRAVYTRGFDKSSWGAHRWRNRYWCLSRMYLLISMWCEYNFIYFEQFILRVLTHPVQVCLASAVPGVTNVTSTHQGVFKCAFFGFQATLSEHSEKCRELVLSPCAKLDVPSGRDWVSRFG